MSQQAGILVVIDVDAAVRAGRLIDNIYLFDNQKWMGSAGEGTPRLVTAVDGIRAYSQSVPQVLNWLVFGIVAFPPTLPKSFFITQQAGSHADLQPQASGLATPQPQPKAVSYVPRLLDIEGNDIGSPGKARRNVSTAVPPPPPQIVNITGEAVTKGVMFPAQYGSPDLLSEGLYWSASVNTDIVGLFAYTLHIALYYYPQVDEAGGDALLKTVTMTHEAYVQVTNGKIVNGFSATPAMIPIS
jgi:hypothetical protein